MVQEITVVLAKYSSPVEAAKLLEATLPSCGLSRFRENAFRRFLKDIRPRNTRVPKLNRPLHDFEVLADPWTYEELCSSHFRASRKNEVNPKSLPTAYFISVPMGGKVKNK